MTMLEFNVLQLAILISTRYKYFLFQEVYDNQLKDPLNLTIKVLPFQKLQDAKAVKSLYGESVYMIRSLSECQILFDIAEGYNGIKYFINNPVEFPKLQIKKALTLVN